MKNLSIKNISGGTFLLVSLMMVNIINLILNAYLGRVLSFESFGLFALVNTFLFLLLIPLNAFSTTVNHYIAYRMGNNQKKIVKNFLTLTRAKLVKITLITALIWILLTPVINNIYQINDIIVPLLFAPVILIGGLAALNKGILQGAFNFKYLSLVVIFEAASKLIFAGILIRFKLDHWVYISVPLSIVVAYLLSNRSVLKTEKYSQLSGSYKFPKKFFIAVLISGISSMAFFTFDLLLAKYFLHPNEAGQYALLSLIGKMVYFFGILPSYLVITFVSNDEGRKINPRVTFYKLFFISFLLTIIAFTSVISVGNFFFPIIFGKKVIDILSYTVVYSGGIAFLTLSATINSFHIAKKQYLFPVVSILVAFFMCCGIILFHQSIYEIVHVIFFSSLLSFGLAIVFHFLEISGNLYSKERLVQLSDEK